MDSFTSKEPHGVIIRRGPDLSHEERHYSLEGHWSLPIVM